MPNQEYKLSVNIVISNKEGQILLLKRSSTSRFNPGRWDLPGGKIDACEEFQEALKREILEETGLEVSVTGLGGASAAIMNGTHVIFLVMRGEITSDDREPSVSNEHDDFLWIEPGAISDVDLCEQFRDIILRYA